MELERLEGTLRTVQLALEILTGACATLPDPEADAPLEDGGDKGGLKDDEEGKYSIALLKIAMTNSEFR
jgi:hypothetical protein